MAKVTLNQLLEAFRGRVGRMVFRPWPDRTILLSGAPRYRKGKGRWRSSSSSALTGCMNPPVIHRIEQIGGCIRVEVTGNIWVERVQVTVFDEGGSVLERGSAIQVAGNWWEYASFTEGKRIVAEAWGVPGNRTQFAVETQA